MHFQVLVAIVYLHWEKKIMYKCFMRHLLAGMTERRQRATQSFKKSYPPTSEDT